MVSIEAICEWFPPEGADDVEVPEPHECGYCKDENGKKKGSTSNGIWAHEMSTNVYQKLIDRGWRRSGSYLYKPCMAHTCCPQYTIRQPVDDFKLSKSQRKAIRKFSQKINVDTAGLEWREMLTAHQKSGKLDVKLVKIGSDEFKTTKADSLRIYQKYQVAIHKDKEDEITERQWMRFLCAPPRDFENESDGNQGAYHQQYWLDGKLIAVGVVDWLTHSYSSVYLYYDPDYSEYNMGVYSALNEIKFCLDNNIAYYYLGYYVPGCSKMEYKAAYKPSQLLCPVTLTWVDLDQRVLDLFKKSKFNKLQTDDAIPDFKDHKVSSFNALLLHKGRAVRRFMNESGPEKFELYCKLVGAEISESLMLCYHH